MTVTFPPSVKIAPPALAVLSVNLEEETTTLPSADTAAPVSALLPVNVESIMEMSEARQNIAPPSYTPYPPVRVMFLMVTLFPVMKNILSLPLAFMVCPLPLMTVLFPLIRIVWVAVKSSSRFTMPLVRVALAKTLA